MFCSDCGKSNAEDEQFCRSCGRELPRLSMIERRGVEGPGAQVTIEPRSKDPDHLTGKGIGNVIVGDGFFMVAVILSVVESSVSSMLWLFLLIPAFFFFGRGFADVLHARQIRRRKSLESGMQANELPPARATAVESFVKVISGELTPVPSVTERTTRKLK